MLDIRESRSTRDAVPDVIHAFGRFELDTDAYELRCGGRRVHVEPQVFDVLRYLIDHQDRVVTKENLLDDVWGDRFVSGSTLSSRIKAARRAVGDDGQSQRVIQTVHGRGYRFVADLSRRPHAPGRRPRPTWVSHLPPGPEYLLERDLELDILGRLADTVIADGAGVVALVDGEAGSGKTALTRTFVDRVREEFAVIAGGCDDLLAPPTLGPFRDIAQALAGDLAEALASGGHPDAVFPALFRLLTTTPTVLVIEDVHWADDATLDAIRYLARRVSGSSAMLMLTYRGDELDAVHPLRRLLGSLAGPHVRRMLLAPLSLAAVTELAGQDADPATVHAVTRGNPFFVTEVLAAGGEGVPATVRDAVLARVGRLPADARKLVQRLAVVPSRVERWLAHELAAPDAAALASAQQVGVVDGDAGHVWFRHELARQTVETALTAAERIQANRDVLAVLVTRPGVAASRIVHHAERAERVEELLRFGPVAATEASRLGAHRQVAETLRVVLEHAERIGSGEAAALLAQRAYSLYMVNRFEESYRCALQAVTAAERADDPPLLGDALMVLAKSGFWARGPMTARTAAKRAADLARSCGDKVRLAAALTDLARAHSNLATLGIVAEPSRLAAAHSANAVALARELGRDDLLCQALCYLGSSRLADNDQRGVSDLEQAIALASADPRIELRVRAYVNAAGSAYRAGRHDAAERYASDGLRLAAEGEFPAGEYRLRLTGAAVRASGGDWTQAIADLRALLASPDEPGVMGHLARSLLARLLARRGDPSAGAVLAAALADHPGTDDVHIAGPLAAAQLELAWLSGASHTMPDLAGPTLDLARRDGHRTVEAELCCYLNRAGHHIPAPQHAPGPWAPALEGSWRSAADAWARLGERYEQALELALNREDESAVTTGLGILHALGANASVRMVRDRL